MNILGKLITFLDEVRLEIKKVSWPSRKETIHYTIIVIGVSFVTAVFLGGLDLLFSMVIDQLLI